jgi:hypothetical protein
LSVFFGASSNRADTGKRPVYNLGQAFTKESLSNVAIRVKNSSNLKKSSKSKIGLRNFQDTVRI